MISMADSLELYSKLLIDISEGEYLNVVRELCLSDLFFLLTNVCNKDKLVHPWVYDRIREVENSPDGYLDLWAR